MKEKEGRILKFVPVATTSDLHQFAYRLGYDSESLWLAVSQHREVRGVAVGDHLNQWLTRTYKKTQSANNDWVESRFEVLRRDRSDWSIDGMVVDANGDAVGASVWSTYNAFKGNAELRFTLRDIVNYIQKSGEMAYPLYPKYDTVLFVLDKDEERVRAAVEKNTENFKIEDYSTPGIKIIRVLQGKKGKMGTGQFAREGITVGKISFWESRKLRMGEGGFGIFIPRVAFRESILLRNEAYITPLDPEEVRARGGELLEDKYPDVSVIRVDPADADGDFIATALSAERPNKRCPVVLSYTTPRIWLGEGPKHGPGRTAIEPTVSHL